MGRHLKEKAVLGRRIKVKRGVASKALTALASIAVEKIKKKGKLNMSEENSLHRGLGGAAEEGAVLGD